MARLLSLAVILTLLFPAGRATADALDDALAEEGLTRADLGWEPRGYWSRFPADIPYKLRHFDALFAQPLATVTFARTASAAVDTYLDPEALAKPPEQSDGSLYKAVQVLGVDRKLGTFRNYSADLADEPVELIDALLELLERSGRRTTFLTFGRSVDYPDVRAELTRAAADVPDEIRAPLGRLILDLVEADEWCERAFRNVPAETRLAVQRRLDLGTELGDAQEYFPELDDAAGALDEASLWFGGLKAVAAAERAMHSLGAVENAPSFRFDWLSPLGWIRVRGTGDDEVDGDDSFLIVDLGGDDTYEGSVGSPSAGRSLSVLLDLDGEDRYEADERAAQGSGLAGVGVLLDAAGDDRYRAVRCAQGFAQLGLGVLADLGGDDEYVSRVSTQGAAYLGIGLLLDAAGDDSYRIDGDGQGFGGVGGVGTLADRSGNDHYEALRDPAATDRPSSHSQLRISLSNAQGVGSGRRGDGSDGHSWAGGLGQLLDGAGDDEYVAGNWSMGTGYWFGTGILHDAGGNDTYRGVVWSQGSGAHFCIGALIDEGGNDEHLIEEQGSASLAFGHDFTVALLLDLGGDDVYDMPEGDGLGYSINRSVAILLDTAGSDRYRARPGNRPGFARYDDRFADYDGTYTYFAEASSVGLFLDIGGKDDYETEAAADDSVWLDPPDSPNRDVRNLSIGVDRAEGSVELRARPERMPSGR